MSRKLCLGSGRGRDDWTVAGEGWSEPEKGGWKTVAADDLLLTHAMVSTDWR